MPEKLKKYEKSKRGNKLKDYLQSIEERFMKENQGNCMGLTGIIFPLSDESHMATRIYKEHGFPFSTKERIPFKIVI